MPAKQPQAHPPPTTPNPPHPTLRLRSTFLRQVPLLAHLSEESIGRLADALQHVHVGAGETVVAEGDESSGRCFLVEHGLLQVSQAGQEEAAYALGPGAIFGEETLAEDAAVQPATVVALEDARLLLMDRQTALRLVFTPRREEE